MKRSKQKQIIPDFDQMLNGIRQQKQREKRMQEAIGHEPTLTPEQYYIIRMSQLWCRPIIIFIIGMFFTFIKGCNI